MQNLNAKRRCRFRAWPPLVVENGVMTLGASLIGSPPALMKNGKNESGQLGLKLDVQGNKGPLFDRPPWVPLGSLPLT